MADQQTSSEDLERAIEARRVRIEKRVDDISAQFSPGQLLDEALVYAKSGPGAQFTRNLGRSVVENPLPIALAAAGLGWLAIQSNQPRRHHDNGHDAEAMYDRSAPEDETYPVAVISGTRIERVGISDHDGKRHTEFADSAGRKFKALSDEAGHRAGHFADDTGRVFRGFIDETGHQVSDFRDEAGNRIHQASGWAAHNWRKVGDNASELGASLRHRAGHLGEDIRDGAADMGSQARRAGKGLRRQGEDAAHAADDFLHQQPLVGGAIAFAIGALFGGALPHTRQEDEVLGEASDVVKHRAAHEADDLYDRGRRQAKHLHDEARSAAGELHDKAAEAVRTGTDHAKEKAGNEIQR
ncbi:DUF3618 domain-containing protein [Pelagibacterium montanilacus]|uniref:DUF3618 domain-containing protein n=1 Tax=Pelagibacterium montanilacus TaxID=2185280 RepID=UPI000F8E2FFF|nr:DUF3618 domain-containing protein [Pelagibacterium montanilacus]